ncbi:MAG: FtsX-like permease family protein [Luteitalea sp.]|nr:FtsX-like permease family protein [Luteitalea sp.]
MLSRLYYDLRHAARSLPRTPLVTATILVTMALGIGASTAIFGIVNAVLLRPLPFAEADRLVSVSECHRERACPNVINPANFVDWRARSQAIEDMAAFIDTLDNLTGGGQPEEVAVQVITGNFFELLGVEAQIGRAIGPADDTPDAEPVTVLSYELWQRRFGGDPRVVGRDVHLDGEPVLVVGVMPPNRHLVLKGRSLTDRRAELWKPLEVDWSEVVRRGRSLSAIGRLAPGMTLPQAQAELEVIGRALEAEYPDFNTNWTVVAASLHDELSGEVRPALLVLLGAVGLVLLIACANVASLLLARASARSRELAVRTALGASRGQVVRLILTESVTLSLTGGALGVVTAWWLQGRLLALAPAGLLPTERIPLDAPVLGFALLVSIGTGLLFGVAPALASARQSPAACLRDGGRGTAGSARGGRLRRGLVMGEVAMALVLLVGAGLLMRSFANLMSEQTGFDATHVLTARISLSSEAYEPEHRRIGFFRELLDRIEARPGVRSAGAIDVLPFAGLGSATSFLIEGEPEPPPGERHTADVRVADPTYFSTMGIPLIHGRNFTEREVRERSNVVIINETMARQHFGGDRAIGQRVTIHMRTDNVPSEIVGVVGDVKYDALDVPVRAMTYWPHAELVRPSMTLVIRTDGDPLAIAPMLIREVGEMDPELPVARIRPMTTLVSASVDSARFSMLLVSLFAGVALLLAAIGIYGVMSYAVQQRTHEIGVRVALGANAADIVPLVVRQGLWITSVGIVSGLLAALGLTRLLASLLYGVAPLDPLTFASVAIALAAVTVVACWLPARRAARIDPLLALRAE